METTKKASREIVKSFHKQICIFTGNQERHSIIFAKRLAFMHVNGIIDAIKSIQGGTHDVIKWELIKTELLIK